MTEPDHIRQCLERAVDAFQRRPAAAAGEDPAAVARWGGGLRMEMTAPAGQALHSDMGKPLGGQGSGPSPGWLFRAALASCLASSIVMHAALRGITLRKLEVSARSESDARGLLGCAVDVAAGPLRLWLEVEIDAENASAAELRELVAHADAHSPVSSLVRTPPAVALRVTAGSAGSAGD